jgi:hypothetical protein
MNRKILFQSVIVVLVLFGLWLALHRRPADINELPVPTSSSTHTASETTFQKTVKEAAQNNDAKALEDIFSKTIDPAYARYRYKQEKIDPSFDWKQPINFYGFVVDEGNAVVVGASVSFEWNDTSEKGTSKASTVSDGNGFFSLIGRRGKRLYVDVGKEGYYSSGNSRGAAFEYANPFDGLFKPDPNRPVVFHLRKKGVGVDLITSQYGVKPYFGITVPLDGKPVQVDLLERKTEQGQLTVTQIKPEFKNWKQATNWSFRMEIPSGGFIEQNDEFPFTAPEEGYQPIVEFNFQQGQQGWVENLPAKNYYIKFGNPPRYGWLKLDTSIMMEGARFTYAINPDGSRNLEPK